MLVFQKSEFVQRFFYNSKPHDPDQFIAQNFEMIDVSGLSMIQNFPYHRSCLMCGRSSSVR